MKKIIRTASFALFIAAFAAVSGGLFSSMDKNDTFIKTDSVSFVKQTEEENTPEEALPVMTPTGEYYIIREHNGMIGIFASETPETPEMTLDVYVFTLPDGVAELLKSGITCDKSDLYRYIEAFTS